MKLQAKGRNLDVTPSLEGYARKRLSKLWNQLADDDARIEIEFVEERNRRVTDCHVVESAIYTKGRVLRAKEASHDMYASIDLVADKLARQVKKLHDKRVQYRHGGANGHGHKDAWKGAGGSDLPAGYEFETQTMEDGMARTDSQLRIVKTKQFSLGPLSPEEAAEQMSLVGHDFFVFVNDESGETCVLYKRGDGQFGLIEPTIAEASSERLAAEAS